MSGPRGFRIFSQKDRCTVRVAETNGQPFTAVTAGQNPICAHGADPTKQPRTTGEWGGRWGGFWLLRSFTSTPQDLRLSIRARSVVARLSDCTSGLKLDAWRASNSG